MPLVTIIIPVFNTEKYLRKCLNSVVNQTYPNLEIIIINDASPDNSKEIIKQYAKTFKNINVITKIENKGLSSARNTGMKLAQGNYIFFLDSDDWIALDAIQKLVTLAMKYEIQLVNCAFTNIIGPIQLKKQPQNVTISYRDIEQNKELLLTSGTVWNKLYEHNVFGDLKFPDGLWYEDNAFVYPLITKVKKYVNTNEILYYYRRHTNSITISTKLKPNEKTFDHFAIGDCIKKSCIQLGTYEEYKDQLDNIILTKAIATLLECTTWFSIPFQSRIILINQVYFYIKTKFHIDNLLDIPCIKERMLHDKVYQLRIRFLLENLKIANSFIITCEEPLEEAKRIISKYKKERMD